MFRSGRITQAQRDAEAKGMRAELVRHRRVRSWLDRVLRPVSDVLAPSEDETVVCRCEEVTLGALRRAVCVDCDDPNRAKVLTRCGMGLCQGRMCAPTVAAVIARERGISLEEAGTYRIRTPVRPLPLAALTLLEVGRHASGVNAGGVRQLRRHPAEIPLAIAALARWMDLESLLGKYAGSCEFTPNVGQIAVAEAEADMHWIEQRAAAVRALGWTHEEIIGRAELRRLVPALAEHCIGGLISRRDGHATPYLTSQAFRMRALDLGVQLLENARVVGLHRSAAWCTATTAGEHESDILVNCGGACRSPR